jgi:rfaE bifunctional protein kinase chain/domain
MNQHRLDTITAGYAKLRIAIIGDFCLDRYLEIDPLREEISIETGLSVHNVVNVRSQPGGAGTILNNLAALGVGEIFPVGFCGSDGEGYELQRALQEIRGVDLKFFNPTGGRKTFTYTKPLVIRAGKPPAELNRLDQKNWTPTPESVQASIVQAYQELNSHVDAIILLDQVDLPETGVVTQRLLDSVRSGERNSRSFVIADSRRGLKGFPPVSYKMNRAELARFTGGKEQASLIEMRHAAEEVAKSNGRPVFITLAEQGILGAAPDGTSEQMSSLPLRGEIDVVGAGDSVTANLAAALASGASVREAIELAICASSIVVHQLGTTGTATVAQIHQLMSECGML